MALTQKAMDIIYIKVTIFDLGTTNYFDIPALESWKIWTTSPQKPVIWRVKTMGIG
jgi:hypothetical protein